MLFEELVHGFTYSGHPVAAAVALKNLEVMEKHALVPRVKQTIGPYLQRRLRETLQSHPLVGEVRGIGMLAAIELVEDKGTRKPALGLGGKVVAEAGKRGLIMRQRGGADGPPASGDSLCLAPPLMTPEATLDRIVQIVGESIEAAMG